MTMQTLSKISLIEKQLFTPLSNVLIIFDVDQVLIDPVDTILSAKGGALKVTLLKSLSHRLGIESANELYSILIAERHLRLVESETPDLIRRLHLHGHKVMALTAFPTHSFGIIDNVTLFRKTQLQKLDIHFPSFTKNKVFQALNADVLQTKYHFRTPVYQDGILYTGTGGMNAPTLSKGEVLRTFLGELAWTPNRIIFIDDNYSHIKSVHECCRLEKIDFEAYHYKAANNLPGILNKALGRFQFKYLEKNNKWLADNEALILFNHYGSANKI